MIKESKAYQQKDKNCKYQSYWN